MKAFLLGFYLVLSLTKVSASSLHDLCDEFIKNNLSNPANITFNYLTDTENITRTVQIVSGLKDWCDEAFKTSYVSLTNSPYVSINDPSWYIWGVPMIVSTTVAGVTAYIAYREWKEQKKENKASLNILDDLDTRLKGMAADIKDKELDLSNLKNETKNKIKKRKTENDKVINNLDKQLTSLRQSTNERFHGVGQKITANDNNVSKFDKQLTSLQKSTNESFYGIEQKITASNDNINNLYQKLTNLGERK